MSIEATFVPDTFCHEAAPPKLVQYEHATEFSPLSALANILHRGSFSSAEVRLLSSVACDESADIGTRHLARKSIDWLLNANLNITAESKVSEQ